MKKIRDYTDKEVIDLFKKCYFLEISSGFIKCNKETTQTIDLLTQEEMKYLNTRFEKLLKKSDEDKK